MNSPPTDTAATVRQTFPPKLRRSEAIRLCAQFGLSSYMARALIDGPNARVKGKTYGSPTRKIKGRLATCQRRFFFDREELITACL